MCEMHEQTDERGEHRHIGFVGFVSTPGWTPMESLRQVSIEDPEAIPPKVTTKKIVPTKKICCRSLCITPLCDIVDTVIFMLYQTKSDRTLFRGADFLNLMFSRFSHDFCVIEAKHSLHRSCTTTSLVRACV